MKQLKKCWWHIFSGRTGAKTFSGTFRLVFRIFFRDFQSLVRIKLKTFRGQFHFAEVPHKQVEGMSYSTPLTLKSLALICLVPRCRTSAILKGAHQRGHAITPWPAHTHTHTKGVQDTPGTLSGHFLDTPEPGAWRVLETPRRTLPQTPPFFRGHSRGHSGDTSGPRDCGRQDGNGNGN